MTPEPEVVDSTPDEDYASLEETQAILDEYWANADEKELFSVVTAKEKEFYDALERRGFLQMYRLVYGTYYGFNTSNGAGGRWESQTISFEGEDGELLSFCVNEFRSYLDQIVNMTCKNRPSFQAQAINTDFESLAQVESSDTTIQYFYDQVFGERKEKEVAKIEALYAKAWTHIEWDGDGGPDVTIDTEIDSPQGPLPAKENVKAGELLFSKLFPWEVVHEPFRSEYDTHLWRMVVVSRSKWEMIAKYPLYSKRIKEQKGGSTYENMFPGADMDRANEDVCTVRVFYHAKCGAMPLGRRAIFVGDVLVDDTGLPIDEIPLIDFMSCEVHGTSFGSSDLWNLIPLQQMANQILSDWATNVEVFGRPPLVLTEGSDIDLDALANGQKIIYKPAGTDDPAAVKFPEIPSSSPKLYELTRLLSQSISGLNATARGEPGNNISSGAMAALFSQIAVEAQSPRQAALDLMRERIGNCFLQFLKKYATNPQLVAIAGLDERSYMKSFNGSKDLAGVHRVVIKTANPMLRTQAGRLQVAEMLRDWPGQPLSDPKQIIELITSGQFKPMVNSGRTSELRIRRENELLMEGPPVQETPGEVDPLTGMPGPPKRTVPTVTPLIIDNISSHLIGHIEILASPAAQANPAIMDATLTHIMESIDLARNGDPYVALLLGNPPPQQDPNAMQTQQQSSAPAKDDKAANSAAQTSKVPGQDDSSQGPKLPKPAESPIGPQN